MANQCGRVWTTTSFMGTLKHRCETEGAHSRCFCGACGDCEDKDREEDDGE